MPQKSGFSGIHSSSTSRVGTPASAMFTLVLRVRCPRRAVVNVSATVSSVSPEDKLSSWGGNVPIYHGRYDMARLYYGTRSSAVSVGLSSAPSLLTEVEL